MAQYYQGLFLNPSFQKTINYPIFTLTMATKSPGSVRPKKNLNPRKEGTGQSNHLSARLLRFSSSDITTAVPNRSARRIFFSRSVAPPAAAPAAAVGFGLAWRPTRGSEPAAPPRCCGGRRRDGSAAACAGLVLCDAIEGGTLVGGRD